jgi:hypothetical protein
MEVGVLAIGGGSCIIQCLRIDTGTGGNTLAKETEEENHAEAVRAHGGRCPAGHVSIVFYHTCGTDDTGIQRTARQVSQGLTRN